MELYRQPVIVVREVDPVADGNDAYAVVAQVLELYQSAAVSSRESGEVLNDQDIELVVDKALSHLLIALALLEGVARAVAIFIEGQRAAGEPLLHIFLDDRLLVFDRGVVAVKLLVDRNTAVAGDVKSFYQSIHLLRLISQIILYHTQPEIARGKRRCRENSAFCLCVLFFCFDFPLREQPPVILQKLACQSA